MPTTNNNTVPQLTPALLMLLAATCGLLVASLYFAQPLSAPIGQELGLSPQAAGLVVTLAQLGYCVGLFLLTPLGDILENKRLVLSTMGCAALALVIAAVAPTQHSFLLACWWASAPARCRCWCRWRRTWPSRHGAAMSSAR